MLISLLLLSVTELGVVLKVIAAGYTLNLAAETAVKLTDHTWILKAHILCKDIRLDGLSSFLGCFGLGLAFLICACGITAGSCITAKLEKKQPCEFKHTILTGLSVFAGCTVAGTCTFFLFVMLVTLGLKGLILSGFLLALVLILEYKHQRYNKRVSSARMLVLFSMTFMTMHFSVRSGYNLRNPDVICLIPALILLGFSVDKIAFRKPEGYIILSFIILVPLIGVVLGVGIDEYYIKYPLFSETANVINSVVYKVILFTGLVGAIVGALVADLWTLEELQGLSLWVSGPGAVILYNLDIDSPHVSLHSILSEVLGPGGELGLIASFAAASGISLGLVVKSTHINLILKVFAILIIVGIIFYFSMPWINIILTAVPLILGLLNALEMEVIAFEGVTWDFAILAKVTMGATILGLAGLLTLALGEAGFWGVLVSLAVATWKTFLVSGEK